MVALAIADRSGVAAGIKVHAFDRRNLNRIVDIERASFGRDAWPPQLFLDYWRESPQLFLVARKGRRIAGYSITVTGWRGAELESIAVDPPYRESGVAQALLDATVARLRAQRVAAIRLMVSTANEPAIRFYRQYGFARVRLVKNYYGAGRDAWRMRLVMAKTASTQTDIAKYRPESANTTPPSRPGRSDA